MAKKEETEVEPGEQMDLIDIHPDSAKPIIKAARVYKKLVAARQDALAKEVKQKQKILGLIKEAKLKPLEDGTTKFRYDGVTISVTPRDELVKVREEDE